MQSVVLDDGEELSARRVLSYAPVGWKPCGCATTSAHRSNARPGNCRSSKPLSVLNVQPRELGHDRTIVFFNDSDHFHWEKPAELVDVRSGVICSPNNFLYDEPLAEGIVRITALANFERWQNLPEEDYRVAKLAWYDRVIASAVRFMPDFRHAVVDSDIFTPTTIRRFTGHDNGAVYGAPDKHLERHART